MDIELDVRVDVTRMDALLDLAAETRADFADLLPDEARLATDELAANTPPFRSIGKKSVAKGAGDGAVAGDVGRLLTAAESLPVLDRPIDGRVSSRVGELVRARDSQALAIVLPRVGASSLSAPEQIFPEDVGAYHERSRGRSGRVRRGARKALVRAAEERRRIAAAKRRVGLAKSGWAPAAQLFGSKLPGWVTRHGLGRGRARDLSRDRRHPRVIISNQVPYISELDAELRIVARTLRSREVRLRKRVEAAVRHRARKTQARVNR